MISKINIILILLCQQFVSYVEVRPTDLDSKQHVNNAKYIEYLQYGRWEWLRKHGISQDISNTLVVVHIDIDYRDVVKYPDELSINTIMLIEGRKLLFIQRITRQDGVLAAEAKVIMLSIDPTTRKSQSLPNELRNCLKIN